MSLDLTPEEQRWRDELQKLINMFPSKASYNQRLQALGEIRDLAVRLHNSLKQHGNEPKHHQYMIENRGRKPDDPDFYFHIHPVEDLIKFTLDPHANDDPVDETINAEFRLRVYSRRWKHDDVYRIVRTASGWFLEANMYNGSCDKSGYPHVFEALRNDLIQYPHDLGQWFEWLWQQAKDKGLNRETVQKGLKDIEEWIKVTDSSAPVNGVWEGLT